MKKSKFLILKKQVISEFNFERMYAIMVLLNWEWSHKGELKVPDIKQLKIAASEILDSAFEFYDDSMKIGTTSSGGLMATVFSDNIELSFEPCYTFARLNHI